MSNPRGTTENGGLLTELLVLPDGTILAHNITPVFAKILAQLDPLNPALALRALKSHELQPGN